ncbi:MAG TPA: hypothetical protein VFI52_17855 [Gemmatimonadaceae bacterium]|nr:hypothetical protein [Gemmatimonadaceae bacterium]
MRFRPILLMLSGVVVASSACSMDATAPTSQMAPRADVNAARGKPGEVFFRPRPDPFSSALGVTYTVTINPQVTNVVRFGAHTLTIPGRAICAAGSGYGSEYFDQDCRTEKRPVTITALVRATDDSIPRIDFTPQLRFSPRESVMLQLHVPNLTPASPIGNILYCATATTVACVDEAAVDPELRTFADYITHTLFRRIKHFSGYFVET